MHNEDGSGSRGSRAEDAAVQASVASTQGQQKQTVVTDASLASAREKMARHAGNAGQGAQAVLDAYNPQGVKDLQERLAPPNVGLSYTVRMNERVQHVVTLRSTQEASILSVLSLTVPTQSDYNQLEAILERCGVEYQP
jgi:hypothetical protein